MVGPLGEHGADDGPIQDLEIVIIHGVSPQGKAINQGVRTALGEILVIMDDDSRLGHVRVIENLVKVLMQHSDVGMVGASVTMSDQENWLQREAAKQYPRYHMGVVQQVADSDFPGHPCAAFPKKVFIEVGMERENILRGLDPDLRVRIRNAGSIGPPGMRVPLMVRPVGPSW